jgi:hypothetical protein
MWKLRVTVTTPAWQASIGEEIHCITPISQSAIARLHLEVGELLVFKPVLLLGPENQEQ